MISALFNSAVLSARHHLGRNQAELEDVFRRLATGKKVSRGEDGPAALISAERLEAELKALEAESRSLERADVNTSIVDGYTSQLGEMYAEMNALVAASANTAGLSDEEIEANQMQIDSLANNIQRFTNEAISSLDRAGLSETSRAEVEAMLRDAAGQAASLRSGGSNSLANGDFEAAQTAVRAGLDQVLTARGTLGAYQKNEIGPQLRANQVAYENLAESKSRLADTDYAEESSNLARSQILNESGMKVLKLAQHQSRSILDLLS